jgi:hypothetical protein
MSDAAYGDFRKTAKRITPPHMPLLRARVLAAPASTAKPVRVEAVNDPSSGRLYLGEASWPKPNGKELPAKGDECLVALDDENMPWIVAWLKSNWGH